MEKLKTYRIPVRTRTLRGKKYSILTLQHIDQYGKRICKELVLTEEVKYVDVIFLKDDNAPCSRAMCKNFYCILKKKDLKYYPLYQILDKEKYMKPDVLTVLSSGMSLEEFDATLLKFNQKEKEKLKGCTILKFAISKSSYQYAKEVK